MTRKNLLPVTILCALLSACAGISAPPSSQPVPAYRDSIELAGRLSVNYELDGKTESLSGKFNWRQAPARTDVSLASPLGQTIATISVTPQSATLTESGKAPRSAADIDTLSAQTLGWSLPVSGLRDWLQGYALAADGSRFAATPQANSVTTRDGWRLSYVSWQEAATGAGAASAAPRPKRIDAERPASLNGGAMQIRIVIDDTVTQP